MLHRLFLLILILVENFILDTFILITNHFVVFNDF